MKQILQIIVTCLFKTLYLFKINKKNKTIYKQIFEKQLGKHL